MWRYTRVKPLTITRRLIEDSVKNFQDDRVTITDEAMVYIADLYKPLLDKLNAIQSLWEFYEYALYIDPDATIEDKHLASMKEDFLNRLVEFLTWDSDHEKRASWMVLT